MKTPHERSPYDLLQERYFAHPWELLVVCILLNQTSNKQVKPILDEFFSRWPTPKKAAHAEPTEMSALIKPLGLYNRRVQTIIKMSHEYIRIAEEYGTSEMDVEKLHGIGKYAIDSWKMFVHPREIVEDVTDKKLRLYVDWAKERHAKRG